MKKITLIISGVLLTASALFAQKAMDGGKTVVIPCTSFHVTRPLSEIFAENPVDESLQKKGESEDRDERKPQKFKKSVKDGVEYGNDPSTIQKEMGTIPTKAPIANFAGQAATGFRPMDPSGAVGPNHYVQMINSTTFKVFNKTTGANMLTGTFGNLWSPATANAGDPIVLYDKAADRWFMSQFGSSSDNKIYIAVSKTNDPTGAWYTYTYVSPAFPDYLKFSVWQDGYYMTSNQAQKVFCFERTAMLAGVATARSLYTSFSPPNGGGFFVPLPGDASDGTLPPAGTPCPIFSYSDNGWGTGYTDAVNIYKMTVNWTPATPTGTIASAGSIPTAAFDATYSSTWDDCPQPGTTQKLDGIGGVCNFRAQWKTWSGYNTVVLNWAVKISATQRSIKWCELRQNQSTGVWSMYQEGIYTPDAATRWLGSIAMDNNGAIALAYLKSDATSIYPSLCYTGRRSCDPLGTLPITEVVAKAGTGSQTGGVNRVGDYSQTTLDPTDGITFWHTGEYMGASGVAKTQVYSFQLTTCATAASVSIAQTTGTNPSCAGASNTFTATPTNGGTAPTYQWQVNGTNVGTNSPTYTTTTLTNGQIVTCIMTSNLSGVTGSPATSNSITMTIGTLSPTITIAGNSTICAGGTATFTATITNGGTTPAYQWKVNGVNAGTNSSTFTSSTLTNGQTVTCVLTSNATCLSTTTATSNTITMVVTAAGTLPFVENFEAATFPPTGWSINNPDAGAVAWATAGAKTWVRRAAAGNTGSTSGSAGINYFDYNTDTTQTDELISKPISLSGATNPKMTFKRAYHYYPASPYYDELRIFVSTDCGATYGAAQYYKKGVQLATNGWDTVEFTPTVAANWDIDTVNLSAYAGQSIIVKFQGTNKYGNNLYLDDININNTAAAVASVAITSNDADNIICSGTSVTFTATPTNGGTAPTYQWMVGATNVGTNSPTYTTTTLTSGQVVTCVMTSNLSGVTGSPATSNSITMTVNASPVLTITNPTAVCSPATVNLTAAAVTAGSTGSGTLTYWTNAGATTALTTPTAVATSGTYYIKSTTSAGCTDIKPVTVTINPTPVLTITNPAAVCSPATVNLTAAAVTAGSTGSGTLTYWTNAGATTSLTTPAAVTTSGTYYIKSTTAAGCADIKPVTVTINSAPVLTITNPAAVCSPATVNLTAAAVTAGSTGSGTLSYWTNAGATTSLTTPTAVATTGTYYIKSTTSAGCTDIKPVTVTINPAPVLTITNPVAVCAPATVNLTATAVTAGSTGSGTLSYWTDAAATASLTTPTAVATGGTYYIKSTTAAGCTDIKPVTVTINPAPVLTITNPAAVCSPATVNITAAAVTAGSTGSGTLSYWTNAGATTSLTTPTAVTTSGTYYIKSTTAAGCTDIKPVTVTINPTPVLTITNPAAVCAPATVNLTAAAVTAGSTGAGTLSYWTNAGATTSLTTPAAVTTSGTYYIKSTTAGGCTDIKPVTVTINAQPASTFTQSASQCLSGNAFSFTNTGGTGTYSWTFAGGSPASSATNNATGVTFSTAGTHAITHTVTSAAGCASTTTSSVTVFDSPTAQASTTTSAACGISNGSITLGATTGGTSPYTYSVNGSAFTSTTSYPGLAAAGYSVIVKDANGCQFTTTVVVPNSSGPTAQASTTTAAGCTVANGSITLGTTTGGTGPYTFSIDGSGFTTSTSYTNLASGNHSVIVKDVNGCQFTAVINVPTSTGPTAQAFTSSPEACGSANGSVTLGAVTGGAGPFTYSFDGSAFTTSTTYTGLAAGSYAVITKDANGCSYSSTATVSSVSGPTALATTTGNSTCGGNDGTISIGNVTGGTSPYTYSVDGGSFATTTSISGLIAGSHAIIVKDANGCQFTTSATVANTGTTPATPTITLSGSTLTSSSATGNQWYLNGVAISGATGQTYTFTVNGNYTVIVTTGGCSSAESSVTTITTVGVNELTVDPYGLLVYPNPNDGNFTVSFVTADKSTFTVEIFNALGQVVVKDEMKDFTGTYSKRMNVVEYGRGVYTISLTNSRNETVKKIIVY